MLLTFHVSNDHPTLLDGTTQLPLPDRVLDFIFKNVSMSDQLNFLSIAPTKNISARNLVILNMCNRLAERVEKVLNIRGLYQRQDSEESESIQELKGLLDQLQTRLVETSFSALTEEERNQTFGKIKVLNTKFKGLERKAFKLKEVCENIKKAMSLCNRRDFSSVLKLIQEARFYGFDWNASSGAWVFKMAIQMRNVDLVAALIQNGANVNLSSDWALESHQKQPPLWLATRMRSRPIIRLLLENGADRNSRGCYAIDFSDCNFYFPWQLAWDQKSFDLLYL